MAREMLEGDRHLLGFNDDNLDALVNEVFESKWDHIKHREALKKVMKACYDLGNKDFANVSYRRGYEDGYGEGYDRGVKDTYDTI